MFIHMCTFIYYYAQANVSYQLFPYVSMTAVTLQIMHNGRILWCCAQSPIWRYKCYILCITFQGFYIIPVTNSL